MSELVQLQISSRPKLVKCGLSEHGLQGREEYELPTLWCLHLYFYELQIAVGGRTHFIRPGSLTVIPPGTRIVYHYTARRHRHFFVHFALRAGPPAAVSLPLCQHVPGARDEILDRLQNIQRIRNHNLLHAEIAFWSLLWDVAESATVKAKNSGKEAAFFQKVDELLDAGLPEKTNARGLAHELGLSMAHVNRTIKTRHGITTVQLIRKRRLQRAYHLLLHSTMPIKLVAAECGMSDLQQFNKQMRLEYGQSPRTLRESHTENSTWTFDRQ
jgi:AraC-like DNA-binding protein